MTRLVLVRHGETDWNLASRLAGQQPAPRLTDLGREQAGRAGVAVAAARPSALVTSDLPRAAATAAAVGQSCGLSARAEPLLRERHFGALEGLTFDQVRAGVSPAALADPAWRPPGGGESLDDLLDRARRFLAACSPGEPGPVAAVTHAGMIRCLLAALGRPGGYDAAALAVPAGAVIASDAGGQITWLAGGPA